MAQSTTAFISTLNGLIETLKDGQNGFQEAAQHVQDASLRSVFMEYATQRREFSTELQQEVSRLGQEPEQTGSVAANLHRRWIDIKAAITGRDDHAILEECERGEDSAVQNYRDALKEDMPSDLRAVVQRQYQAVQQAHDRVRSLRNATRS